MEVSSSLVKNSSHGHHFQLSSGCCMQHGPNQNIKCNCTYVRCLIFGQHVKCKYPCTKLAYHFSHTQHHINSDKFDTVCTVHRNQLYKQTKKMHFLYVFILQFLYSSTCFERPFRSSSGVHDLLYLQLCTNHTNVSNSSVWRLEPVSTVRPSS